MAQNQEPWGWHLLIDCKAGNSNISDMDSIVAFVEKLVKDIDMVAYGPCWIERFATHDPAKAGISFCQMIETSNITGHFVDASGDFYLDIFSCKPYNSDHVVDLVYEWFNPMSLNDRLVLRQA